MRSNMTLHDLYFHHQDLCTSFQAYIIQRTSDNEVFPRCSARSTMSGCQITSSFHVSYYSSCSNIRAHVISYFASLLILYPHWSCASEFERRIRLVFQIFFQIIPLILFISPFDQTSVFILVTVALMRTCCYFSIVTALLSIKCWVVLRKRQVFIPPSYTASIKSSESRLQFLVAFIALSRHFAS